MTVRKSFGSLLLLSLCLAFVFAGPVFPGENPWDRDDGPGEPDVVVDTVGKPTGFNTTSAYGSGSADGWGWFDRLYVGVTLEVSIWISNLTTTEVKAEQVSGSVNSRITSVQAAH